MKTLSLTVAAAFAATAAFAQSPAKPMPWQKKAQFTTAPAKAAPKAYAKAASKAGEMITEQPEGTLYKNMYAYAEGFESMWGEIYESKKDGAAKDFVVGADGSYYLKNPISFMPTDSWIKGDKAQGDTIVFKLPQHIYNLYDEYDDSNVKYYASRLVYQQIDGQNQYVIDEKSQDIKFVWRNDSLIKVNDGALLGMTSESGSWNGLGDLTQESTICPFTNEAPADPSKAVKYVFTFHPSERTTTQRISNVVIEGNDFYADNIDTNIPGAWIHGKIKDGKVTFSGTQFLGLDESAAQFRFNFPASVYYDEDTYETIYKTLGEVTLDYDEASKTFSLDDSRQGFMTNYGYRVIALQMEVLMKPSFEEWSGVVDRPQNPTILNFQPATSGSGWIIFDLPRNNAQDSFMDQNNVYFNVYFDDELVTFYPDQYLGLKEEMTDVPIDFNDTERYDFQYFGSQHRVVVYDSGFERAGIQAFYLDGDRRLYSDIAWSDGTYTGINAASATGAQPKSTTYTDLSGRAVQHPQNGIFIKTTVMSDGSVKTSKVVVK